MSRKLGKRKLQERINEKIKALRSLGVEPTDKTVSMYVRGDLKGALDRLSFEVVLAYVRDTSSFISAFVDWQTIGSVAPSSPLAARNSEEA